MTDGKIHIFRTGIYYSEVHYYALLAAVKMRLCRDRDDWLYLGMKKKCSYINGKFFNFFASRIHNLEDTIFSDINIADDGEMYIVAEESEILSALPRSGKYFNRKGLCKNLQLLSQNYDIFNKVDEFVEGKIRDCFYKNGNQPINKVFDSICTAIDSTDKLIGHPIFNPFVQAVFTDKKKELQNKIDDVLNTDTSLLYESYVIKDLNDTHHEMVSILEKEMKND